MGHLPKLIGLLIGLVIVVLVSQVLLQKNEVLEQYQSVANEIRQAGLESERSWRLLKTLVEQYPGRLSGTQTLESAIEWVAQTLRDYGVNRVNLQPVDVLYWVRGEESLTVNFPDGKSEELEILGLGMSVGADALTAGAVVVDSYEALEARSDSDVTGKFVVYNVPFTSYRDTVTYRVKGPDVAAAKGAVGALVRTVGSKGSHPDKPHTGTMRYGGETAKIPAAALSFNAADRIAALAEGGTDFTLTLNMAAQTLGAQSQNIIAEVPGATLPEEVVVFGGHIDSWDITPGAHDDGTGVTATMEALLLLNDLIKAGTIPRPKRSLRLVHWTNEENGLAGAKAYAESLSPDDIENHVAALEMDTGGEAPFGFGFTIKGDNADRAYDFLSDLMALLEPLESHQLAPSGGGADITPLGKLGIPTAGVNTVMKRYFDWHHSVDDSLEQVRPKDLKRHATSIAILVYVLADSENNLKKMAL